MRKLFLFMVMAFFGTAILQAQVKFGAKAGVNFASITGEDTDDLDGITSFHIGAMVEIPVSEKFSVQPELLYSAQGATTSEDGMDLDFKVNYINVPIMAKYFVAEGLSLEAGPQLGFLIDAEIEGGDVSIDIKDQVNSFDFGVNFGLGYKLDSGLNFGARYNLGLSDGNDDPEFFESEEAFKNGVFQFSIGYFF
ncbi:porin family protein [Winogradskyella vincentii]|uniref:PorT family protein n=1 Tax=Winogradskyella vincentii TaxID=2877122 RepID=A0ABS7Y1N5_9FLAO|nr:porin family protein [Winogradskyella vincentii]MCA0153848.1 PorT family protein [Winogradskyella vincentii]